jgi:hypothetical protein
LPQGRQQLYSYSHISTIIFYASEKKISPPILDPSAREGQRQLADLSGDNYAHFSIYEVRSFDELNRGSILGPKVDANN